MADNTEILRRRTFAIIAHPDAGKTSLTEKLLLFGGQIQVAGAVKSNKIKKTATSDWMEIEKQRGISVTTSVMEFDYRDYKINILDTPGHQDFAEDTYRTLSGGIQFTDYGLSDNYQTDTSFSCDSYSLGIGAKLQLSERADLNVGYMWTNYEDYTKTTQNYNGLGLPGTNVYSRTNKVFGLSIDYRF